MKINHLWVMYSSFKNLNLVNLLTFECIKVNSKKEMLSGMKS